MCDRFLRWNGICVRRIAELAVAEGKAVVLVINKWDLVEDRSQEAMKRAEENVKGNLRHVSWAKCVFTSATEGMSNAIGAMVTQAELLQPPLLQGCEIHPWSS